jgi:hypothetical protein
MLQSVDISAGLSAGQAHITYAVVDFVDGGVGVFAGFDRTTRLPNFSKDINSGKQVT